jgi:repressor LexA
MTIDEEIKKQISERLRERRKEIGLSQKELANRIGMPVSTIHRWENEQSLRDIIRFRDLVFLLEVPGDYLLGLIDNKEI